MTTWVPKAKIAALTALLFLTLLPVTARSEESWRANFEQTCAKTSDAMTLSLAELNALLERCSSLQKIIETQEESVRKVYLKRLQLCRNLYAYMVEYRQNEQASK
jgi:uncharacterized membrane protein